MTSSNFSCGPCGYEYISKDAHKWCTICEEGFCKDCERMHRATKMSRSHKLIGIEEYKKISHISVRKTCEEHGKTLDLYCKTHDSVLCLACGPSHHKFCEDIIPLEDAAQNAKSSTSVSDLEETISVILKNIHSIVQHTSSADLNIQEKNVRRKIREFRKAIDTHLDKIEQNLVFELELELAKYKSKYEAVSKHMKESERLMIGLKEQTNEMKQFASDLQVFLGARQMIKTVHESLKTMSGYSTTDKYNINVQINPVLNSMLKEVKKFGNLHIDLTEIKIPLSQPKIGQAQIHVDSPVMRMDRGGEVKLKEKFSIGKGSNNMLVTGCATLPNGQLVIADYWGSKRLMQYNQNGTHVRTIPLNSEPYDVTVIDSERVAVSYGDSGHTSIEILNIEKKIVGKNINLHKDTWGLSYREKLLYVVVDRRDIAVIELSGKMVRTLKCEADSLGSVTTIADRIYCADCRTNAVMCYHIKGQLIWKFLDDSVVDPVSLKVDSNQNVFVVGRLSHNVTKISRDGRKSKTLLTKSDGLNYPRAICFSENTGNFCVCNERDGKAHLFKITW